MRDSLGKPAYFHGGRTEEVFQQQLDQVLAERMTQAQGGRYAEAMYDLQFGDSHGASTWSSCC
jgi:flagellar protein FlgJ